MKQILIDMHVIKSDGKINSANYHIFNRHPNLLLAVNELTAFLPSTVSRYERLFNISKNFTTLQLCKMCLNYPCRFLGGKGYSSWCSDTCKNISRATKNRKINPNTGISTNQQRGQSAAKSRNKVNPITGLTGYQESTKKTVKSRNKVNPITGLTGYQESFNKSKNKIRASKENAGTWIPLCQKTDYELYKKAVRYFMYRQPLSSLPNYEFRGRANAADKNAYHLDHKFSMKSGFLKSIPPYIIGHISNLECIPWSKNVKKGSSCSISEQELFDLFFTQSR